MAGPFINPNKSALVVRNEKQLPLNLRAFFDDIKNSDEVEAVKEYSHDWLKLETKKGCEGLFAKDNLDGFDADKKFLPAQQNAPLFVFASGWIVVIAPGGPSEAV